MEKLERFITAHLELGEWTVDETGVYKSGKNDGRLYASYIPIVPYAILVNKDTGIEKVDLAFFKNNRWNHVITDRSIVASQNKIVLLADKGIEVSSVTARTLVEYIYSVTARSLDKLQTRVAKTVMGWDEEDGKLRFMPYTKDLVFDGEENFKYLHRSISRKGTLQEWVDFFRPLRNNLAFRLTMAASFASPLIQLVGENSFVYLLRGGTGSGKTVALMCAMSIFGDPSMGKMTRTMNMTTNSMLTTASFLNNLPFGGDELQTIKSRWQNYDQLVMCVTEGIDRGRMRGTEMTETKSWRCSFVFTGEDSIVKANSGAGAKNRCIEVETMSKLIEDGNATANFVREHYGCAGREYIASVMEQADTLRTEYSRIVKDLLLLPIATTDKQAGAMALILLGDRIASELFWAGEEQIQYKEIERYLAPSVEVDISERAYDYICDIISANNANFGEEARICWGEKSGDSVYINRTILVEQLNNAGYDFNAVRSAWAENGYITKCADGKYRHMKRINRISTSCILLNLGRQGSRQGEEVDII